MRVEIYRIACAAWSRIARRALRDSAISAQSPQSERRAALQQSIRRNRLSSVGGVTPALWQSTAAWRPMLLGAGLCFAALWMYGSFPTASAQDAFDQPRSRAAAAPEGAESTAAKTKAQHSATIPTDPIGLFKAGGILMWPLLFSSIVAVWVALERLVTLRRRRVIPRAFVDRFLQHIEEGALTPEAALGVCEENASPIATIFAHGVRKWGKPSVEVEQAIIDGGERQVAHLRRHLRILHGVYTVTPMLGLLGTVWGMIHGFNDLAMASGVDKAERLSQHIAVAFLNTAGGLVVAIPALILYMYFTGRVEALVMEMDELSQRLVNMISAEGLSVPVKQVPKPSAQMVAAQSAASAKAKQPVSST